MNVEVEKLKAEIEDDLRSIQEFFETALKSYELTKPASIISAEEYSVTQLSNTRKQKTFFGRLYVGISNFVMEMLEKTRKKTKDS